MDVASIKLVISIKMGTARPLLAKLS